ncbi:hypothetical protein [Alkalicoccus daliensis]|uniref:Small peptidoglycan-associated lipoprotein n=1 Tax=Alkalicoccus daliensis TaxID=745820 RepID=A0A1H0HUJ0_9BACI|nr:hypothetical protein [Alkalicoccus daliensis]SDO22807.1 hypothetical protein SAMN04488053_10947 [Alkalicoccus daliensis]
MRILILLIFLAAVSFGCKSADIYEIIPELTNEDSLHAIVLIEETEDENNHPYFNALIDISSSKLLKTHVVAASDHPEVPLHFEAESLPCLILFEAGEVVMHIDDVNDTSELLQMLQGNLMRFTRQASDTGV